MLKRKFSLHISSNRQPKMEPATLEVALASHRVTSSPAPSINRRQLSASVEAELRAACKSLVRSHTRAAERAYEMQAGHQAHVARSHRTTRQRMEVRAADAQKPARSNVSHRLDDGGSAPPSYRSHNFAAEPTLHAGGPAEHTSTRRKSGAQRGDATRSGRTAPVTKKPVESPQVYRESSYRRHGLERAKSATTIDSLQDSYSTPRSNWTETQSKNTSTTGLTSTTVSPDQLTKHVTQQTEHFKRQPQGHADRPYRPSSASSSVTSLAKSIKSEIQEYVRPSSLSRRASRESLRSNKEQSPNPPPSSHGWHSWGLHRRSSKGSLRGSRRKEPNGPENGKQELNLNRDLPPLPRIDRWQEEPKPSAHIASLIKTGAANKPHAASRDWDYTTVRPAPTSAHAVYQPPQRQPTRRSSSQTRSSRSPHRPDSAQTTGAAERPSMTISIASTRPATMAHRPPSASPQTQPPQARPNFSRKISGESQQSHAPSSQQSHAPSSQLQHPPGAAFASPKNAVETAALHPKRSRAGLGGLKRALSVLALGGGGARKDKRSWMGEKSGGMIPEESAGAPVVRLG